MCPHFGGDRVDVSVCWGWSGGCVPVLGVSGWMSQCRGGGLVDVSVWWGWTGGCLGVMGVSGWMSRCVGGDDNQ